MFRSASTNIVVFLMGWRRGREEAGIYFARCTVRCFLSLGIFL